MKKVIDGKIYDTETAELLHDWDNGRARNDFNFMEESLYRTKKGAFFLHGRGGPLTIYAASAGDLRTSGRRICPLTRAEALRWLEAHDGTEAILEHFAEDVEGA